VLTALPDTLAVFRGPTSKRRRGEGTGRITEGREDEKREGRGLCPIKKKKEKSMPMT